MNEYYGAPNDFRNYVSHSAFVDKVHKKFYRNKDEQSTKHQTAEDVRRDREDVAKFKDAEKNFLKYRYQVRYGNLFKPCEVLYETAKQHVRAAIEENRPLTSSEHTSIRQFVESVSDCMKAVNERETGVSTHVSGGSRY